MTFVGTFNNARTKGNIKYWTRKPQWTWMKQLFATWFALKRFIWKIPQNASNLTPSPSNRAPPNLNACFIDFSIQMTNTHIRLKWSQMGIFVKINNSIHFHSQLTYQTDETVWKKRFYFLQLKNAHAFSWFSAILPSIFSAVHCIEVNEQIHFCLHVN